MSIAATLSSIIFTNGDGFDFVNYLFFFLIKFRVLRSVKRKMSIIE